MISSPGFLATVSKNRVYSKDTWSVISPRKASIFTSGDRELGGMPTSSWAWSAPAVGSGQCPCSGGHVAAALHAHEDVGMPPDTSPLPAQG